MSNTENNAAYVRHNIVVARNFDSKSAIKRWVILLNGKAVEYDSSKGGAWDKAALMRRTLEMVGLDVTAKVTQ